MRRTILTLVLSTGLAGLSWAQEAPQYSVRLAHLDPPQLEVNATVELKSPMLSMVETRPADVPEVGAGGWPAMIENLQVRDMQGKLHELRRKGASGWDVVDGFKGVARLHYSVDYAVLAKSGWPAPREAAFGDAEHLIVVGRSVFITPGGGSASPHVHFEAGKGWQVIAPWKTTKCGNCYEVTTAEDLTENLLVFIRERPEIVTVGGFTILAIPLGPWRAVRPQIRELLAGVIPQYVSMFGNTEQQEYSVVLLPQADEGGESCRASFAFNYGSTPTATDRDLWGHTIAHEIFHYWNGWRMRGADYASSQWFQEGFTEYGADLAMLNAHLLSPEHFRNRLAGYVEKYRLLKTAMARPGNHKGPPLYSAGALVAFAWDVEMRRRTGGRKSIRDVLSAVWRETEDGERQYGWEQIRTALEENASGTWQSFYDQYIEGTQRLPLNSIFESAGLRLSESGESVSVEPDTAATPEARGVWKSFANDTRSRDVLSKVKGRPCGRPFYFAKLATTSLLLAERVRRGVPGWLAAP